MPIAAQARLKPALIETICASLAINPNWNAAADHAGISDRTLRLWRTRAETYANRYETDNDTTDLAARRLYKAGLDHHTNHDWSGAQRALQRLWDHIDNDPDLPYYEATVRFVQARATGELELVDVIRKAANAGDWRAALALLRAGWPDRYSERVEVTGAAGGPISVDMVAEAEERAEVALAEIRAKRSAAGQA